MKTAEERLAERERQAEERIARREAASQRRIEAHAERVRAAMLKKAERQIQSKVLAKVRKEHSSTRLPVPAPPTGHKERFLTKLLGTPNPRPVVVTPRPTPTTTKKAARPAPGTRRVKTPHGWITLKKKKGAITTTLRKSKNRLKRSLGELLR